jgi:hypothetical protein
MLKYMRRHEGFVRRALAGELGELSLEELRLFHDTQIRRMQHERLIHLIVTMFVATFVLAALILVTLRSTLPGLTLLGLLTLLASAYVVHYFKLENSVQRWYRLANSIDAKMGRVSACYD